DRVYILKSGRVVLRSRDIETGQEINDLIQTGEFFGVKSALGHFPREEDAVVLSDAQVVQFSVAEFESLVSSNTRIIIKMLKVFSGQLRRIHSKVSSMLNQDDVIDSAEGLHHSAEFYFRNRQYDHARYIWRRYLELYPNGRHAEEARKQIERAGQSATAHSARSTPSSGGGARPRSDLPEIGQLFFEAESSFANGKYDEAVEGFKLVIDRDAKGEYRSKAQVQLGRSYFEKGDYGLTIRHYSALLKEAPRHPQMAELLYHIGSSYGRSGDTQKGRAFLAKARSGVSDDPALERKIESALAQLEH
ncbi:MAG: outer membrane protein assembly factor BamD, partial [Spirochaetales bacterium]|nr:outer membrane protein assembly factor BamD [Spirochaetales bacterium]